MKVIELLTKIANGEEVPEKIEFYGHIWYFNEYNQQYDKEGYGFKNLNIWDGYNFNILNEEVEIIEDKKIEKIDVNYLQQIKKWKRAKVLGNKINEIIDKINKMEDK